jgi:hypothetical protein
VSSLQITLKLRRNHDLNAFARMDISFTRLCPRPPDPIPMESWGCQLSACGNSLGGHSVEFIKYLGSNYEVVFLRYEYPLNRKLTDKEILWQSWHRECPFSSPSRQEIQSNLWQHRLRRCLQGIH